MSAMTVEATILTGAAASPPRILLGREVGNLHFDPVTGSAFHLSDRMARRRGIVEEETDGQWDDAVRALEDYS